MNEIPESSCGRRSFEIGLATFGILALELALIRWTSSQVRIFAYFNNLVLIGAFLGMGLGVALGSRHPKLVHGVTPILFVLCLPLAFSEELNIVRISFPDRAIFLWGAEQAFQSTLRNCLNIAILIFLFGLIVTVFLCAGAPVGHLFPKLRPLRAYSSDLTGSLLGVLVFTLTTFFNTGPAVWLCIGVLPFMWFSRKVVSVAFFAGIVALGAYSVKGAVFSPYNRIDIRPSDCGEVLQVNRDFHQYLHDLSDDALLAEQRSGAKVRKLAAYRDAYDLSFQVNDARHNALIVGAGTGNDAQAALRNGYGKIYSVDIDGVIIDIGRRRHPEKPYNDPKVIPVVNDARAFFEQYDGELFDTVCFGLLDSHAMFSSMSSLRLDNYVYTEESIRKAWQLVSERGHLSISFSLFGGQWIADRLYWTIAKATGREPIAVRHGMHHGATFFVPGDKANFNMERLARYPAVRPSRNIDQVTTTSDDWPFLYVRPGLFPWGYVIVLIGILSIAGVSVPMAFGWKTVRSNFDPLLFFMGAAFLLIETRGVTSLSLLFGSTWIVNSSIFAGILVMVLVANMMVERFNFRNPLPWFALLLISAGFLWAFNWNTLNNFPMLARGLVGGLVNAVPIGFAGVIVSILLAKSTNAGASLASNLIGSVLGGCLEYCSMVVGLRALVVLAIIFYLMALFCYCRRAELSTAGKTS